MKLHLQYPHYIWLLGAIGVMIILFAGILIWKKRVSNRIGDKKLVHELMKDYSPLLFLFRFILVCLAFTAGVLAVANPRKAGGKESVTRKGIDIVIALDVSNSMLAMDLEPNRLERAKQMAVKLTQALPNDRFGLIVFAGRAYMQMPLTNDLGATRLYLNSASPNAVPSQGTMIEDAFKISASTFNNQDERFKSIILITDGEDHDEETIEASKELAESGIMVNVVGVGSPNGSTIPDPATKQPKVDQSGNVVITRLNEPYLQQIAQQTNGIYVRLVSSDEAVNALVHQLSQIEGKAYGDVSLMNYESYFPWLAGLMFILLVIETILPQRKRSV